MPLQYDPGGDPSVTCHRAAPAAPRARAAAWATACAATLACTAAAGADPLAKVARPDLLGLLADDGATASVVVLLEGFDDLVGEPRASDPSALRALQAEVARAQLEVLERLPPGEFELRHRYENLLAFSGHATAAGLRALVRRPEVVRVEDDPPMELHLADGIALMEAGPVRAASGGRGVAVAVTDTGIDYAHPRLGGGGFPNAKVIGGWDFWNDDPDPMDTVGHGTGVAGIIAGELDTGPGTFVGGVAPEAKLYALKVFPDGGGGTNPSTQAAAWDWVVSHALDDPANPILIINASLGGPTFPFACDGQPGFSITTAAARNLAANGIAIFASSGNSGLCDRIAHPACLTDVISVGAVFDADLGSRSSCIDQASCVGFTTSGCAASGNWACRHDTTSADLVTCYSNGAGFLDLLAPSDCAHTTALGGGFRRCFNGTSAAAPYAAGAAALVQGRALAAGRPPLSPTALADELRATGVPVTDPKNGITTPRVDLSAHAIPLEDCVNARDDDGDLLADCEDPDCRIDADGDEVAAQPCGQDCDDGAPGAFTVPSPVTGLTWTGPDDLTWDEQRSTAGSGTVYQVLRGRLSGLPVGSGLGESCLATVAVESLTDPVRPGPSDGFYHVVRARNACSPAQPPYGTDWSGGERLSATCP